MQSLRVILLTVCLAGVATAASWGSNKICEHCKQGAANIKAKIPQIEEVIAAKCNAIPFKQMRDECIKGEKNLIDYLRKETPEQICQDIHRCPPTVFTGLGRLQQPMCALCETCKQLAQMVKSGAMQVKDQLKGLCKNCGAPENVKKCEQAIDNFINQVEEKSPEELCTEIGLCKH